eukprot:GILI01001662.1.p1 GENE.GILI01001662.1~~GILI01001662.1.p1  ORF type:complete len:201 (+),score=39.02 GILI01001662.1:95-697(+)
MSSFYNYSNFDNEEMKMSDLALQAKTMQSDAYEEAPVFRALDFLMPTDPFAATSFGAPSFASGKCGSQYLAGSPAHSKPRTVPAFIDRLHHFCLPCDSPSDAHLLLRTIANCLKKHNVSCTVSESKFKIKASCSRRDHPVSFQVNIYQGKTNGGFDVDMHSSDYITCEITRRSGDCFAFEEIFRLLIQELNFAGVFSKFF